MLQEVKHVRQIQGEPFRRWFSDDRFELFVWHGSDNQVIGFQLCYREGSDQKALTWQQDSGFTHNRIDDGEGGAMCSKMTPILLPDGAFDYDHILALFEKACGELDPQLARLVTRTMREYPSEAKKG